MAECRSTSNGASRVGILTLDDPERRNALSRELVDEIIDAVAAVEADDGRRRDRRHRRARPRSARVPTCQRLASMSGAGSGRDPGDVRDIYDGFLAILDCPLPTIAAVNGPAVGAGFNLALACDVRHRGPARPLRRPVLRIGIHPGGGHTWLLDRAVGPQAAAAMNLFGERLDGERAAEIGLAWECVPDAELLDTTSSSRAAPRRSTASCSQHQGHDPRDPVDDRATDQAVETELTRQRWSFEQGFLNTKPPA